MTRMHVYSAALAAFAAATAMLVGAVAAPRWIVYAVTTPQGQTVEKHIGLSRACANLGGAFECEPYPPRELCEDGARGFCPLWRTAGFMGFFGVVFCLVDAVAFGVIMSGAKLRRETGWPVVSTMVALVAILQLVVVSVVAWLFGHDGQFSIPGWRLGASWYLAMGSAVVHLLAAGVLAGSAFWLPPEGGYEFLEDAREE